MEKITLHNYEAFYLDYLEGNLNDYEQALLFDFLNDNPTLKNELEHEGDVLDFTLNPNNDSLSIFEKENLKHFDCKADEICLKNVDDFIIADIENVISKPNKNKLSNFISEHKLKKRKQAFLATKLKANLDEVYPNHSELKKRGVIIPIFVKIASIAAIGLLLFNIFGTVNPAKEMYNLRGSNFALNIDSSKQKFNINVVPKITNKNISNLQQISNALPKQKNKPKLTPINNKNNVAVNNKKIQNKVKPKKEIKENKTQQTPFETINKNETVNQDVYAGTNNNKTNSRNIKLIDMYKPVTSLTNSYTNLDVSYKKSTPDSDLRVTSFKIGKFYFERKRNK